MALEDRTEQATPQHRQEARKKGQVARSTEVTSAFVLLTGLMVIRAAGPSMAEQLTSAMTRFLGHCSSMPVSPEGVRTLFLDAAMVFFRVTGPLLGAVALAGLAGNLAQVGFMFTTQSFVPDFNRLNPVAGIGRMVSARSAVELFKSILKVSVIGWMIWAFLRNERETVVSLGMVDATEAARLAGDLIWRLCMRVCTALVVIASLDYMYQRFEFDKSLRMTKQQVKEEFKRSEGDPLVKSQFRQKHRQMAMQRMMQDIPNADVVVTNPTHIAVALRYDSEKMAAPVVVAKGKRLIAQRIKEIAKEHRVPVIENKPVARALYKMADVGGPVPVDLYQAVAEILAFVYRLRHGAPGMSR